MNIKTLFKTLSSTALMLLTIAGCNQDNSINGYMTINNAEAKGVQVSERLTVGAVTSVIAGRISNTGVDIDMKNTITRPLAGVPVIGSIYRSGTLVKTVSTATDTYGEFTLAGTESYVADAAVTVKIQVSYRAGRIRVQDVSRQDLSEEFTLQPPLNVVKSIAVDNPRGWHLANAQTLYNWCTSLGMLNLSSPTFATIYIVIGDGTWSNGSGEIHLGDDNGFGSVAHEMGHLILNSWNVGASFVDPGPYLLPDGTVLPQVDARPWAILHEDWADFFGAAASASLYPSAFPNHPMAGTFEQNTGGRDMYIGSTVMRSNRPYNYVGIQNDPDGIKYAVYPFNHNIAYSKSGASFLWDLFDGPNTLNPGVISPMTTGKWFVSMAERVDRISFHDSYYQNAKSNGYFTKSAMANREAKYDLLQVPIVTIFNMIKAYGNDPTKGVRERVDLQVANFGIDGYKLDLLERMHAVSFRLASASYATYNLRHNMGLGKLTALISQGDTLDAEWKIVPCLKDPDNANYVSVESVNYPGTYLRQTNGKLAQQRNDNTTTFALDASWKVKGTTSSTTNQITFESWAKPGYYIANNILDQQIVLTTNANAASFRMIPQFIGL